MLTVTRKALPEFMRKAAEILINSAAFGCDRDNPLMLWILMTSECPIVQ